jgi:hypothetical protein
MRICPSLSHEGAVQGTMIFLNGVVELFALSRVLGLCETIK